MENYTNNDAKMIKKTIPKSNFSSNLDFVKNLVFLRKNHHFEVPEGSKIYENSFKKRYENQLRKSDAKMIKNHPKRSQKESQNPSNNH